MIICLQKEAVEMKLLCGCTFIAWACHIPAHALEIVLQLVSVCNQFESVTQQLHVSEVVVSELYLSK